MIKIKTLKDVDFEIIYNAFAQAFADYEIKPLSSNLILQMITRRGFDSELSFGAFKNDELVSFTLNGIGNWNGKPTAYDTGTGTIKEFRGKGLAKKIFQYSLPELKEKGITQYLLEVLQQNDVAINLYKNQGFEVTREFDYYTANKKDLKFLNEKSENDFQIREIDLLELETTNTFWDFEPSWQNSLDSVKRTIHDFKILGVFNHKDLIAYGIAELNTGDITQLTVQNKYRRKGVGTKLLSHLLGIIPGDSIKIINTQKDVNSIREFLKSLDMVPDGSQYEMIKPV
jgi:ribosomal protein S18 acetylase RimI-like enzyme